MRSVNTTIAVNSATKPIVRCAIYTRKSTDEGLESEFNSLDAQKLACSKYIDIQAHEGWQQLEHNYDDGGFSGANTDRPALKRLLADIAAKAVDVVIVYKIDRLSRSLLDFLNMMHLFTQHSVAFVSVTQQFNTSTSIGRCMLSIMMTFAEYERDNSRERTIDKIAASKKRGMWMGGYTPYGYNSVDKKLVIDEQQAEIVRLMFSEFTKTHSLKAVVIMLKSRDVKTKVCVDKTGRSTGGKHFHINSVYNIISNPIYYGKIAHKGQLYDGQHEAIVTAEVWQAAQSIKAIAPRVRAAHTKRKVPAMLQGLLRCGGCNSSMTPSYTRKKCGKLYRYYVPDAHKKAKCINCPVRQVSAPEVENVVLNQLHQVLSSPEVLVNVWHKSNTNTNTDSDAIANKISENRVRELLSNINITLRELWPLEQQRLLKNMLEKVVVQQGAVEVRIRAECIDSLLEQFNNACV